MEQFKGQWLKLEPESYSTLGRANNQLGQSTLAGTRVWDTQSKFRVRFGPLRFAQFSALLPNGTASKPASELTRFLAGQEFDFDLQLVLQKAEVPACRLSSQVKPQNKPMLGWTTWLKTKPFTTDDEQVVLTSGHLH